MASGKGNTNAAGLLQAVYQAVFTDLSSLLANAASPLTTLYISLHTANPGPSGNQSTNEATYNGGSGYARVAVSRSTSGWVLSGESISNVNAITFPQCIGGSGELETYVGVGTAASGPGILLWFGETVGALAGEPLLVGNGVIPNIATGQLIITES